MKVRCIKARQGIAPGDVVEVPDGAEVSPLYFELLPPEPPSPPPAPAATPAAGSTRQPSFAGSSAPADKETSK